MSSVTVIVCTRDRPDQLARALPAVRAALRATDRALVVDSASEGDGTRSVAAGLGFEVVRAARPGLSHARNVGFARADTAIVAYTDDDCSPEPGWLDALRPHFEDPRIGFVTGRVQAVGGLDDADGDGAAANSTLERPQGQRFERPRDPAGIGHGANMAFRLAALAGSGGFDERLGSGAPLRAGEDADMLYRLLAAGWHGVYEPAAGVTHEEDRDAAATLRLRYGYGLGSGAYRAKILRSAGRPALRMLARPVSRDSVECLYWAARSRERTRIARELAWTAGFVRGAARQLRGR